MVNKPLTAVIVTVFVTVAVLFPFRMELQSINDPLQLNDPSITLDEAKRLSLPNNWYAAAPLFEQAEVLFRKAGRSRDQSYARIGRIRARAEEVSQRDASRVLHEELANPLLHTDMPLRIWCLMSKGAIDVNFDSASAKRDWVEAREIAKQSGERFWVARATGEIGIMEFLEGNTSVAVNDLADAIRSALWSAKTQDGSFSNQCNIVTSRGSRGRGCFRFGILLIAKRFSPYRILANHSRKAGSCNGNAEPFA